MATSPVRSRPTAVFFTAANTAALTVTATSANVAIPVGGDGHLLLTNDGTNIVYIALGTDNTVAAAIPVNGTPANGIPLLPNTQMQIFAGTGTYIAAIAGATGNTLFITPGYGA